MRVIQIGKYYPPHLGGVEMVMQDLSEGLAKDPDTSVRAIVANNGRARKEEVINGVEVVRLPRAFERASTPFSWSMPRELRRHGHGGVDEADIVHLHFPYPWGDVSWLLSRARGRIVITYHADISHQTKQMIVYRPLLNAFLRRADRIVVSSPNMREHSPVLRPFIDKTCLVDFGVHTDLYAHPSAAVEEHARAIRVAHADRPLVLFVGRFVHQKAGDVLIRAMADVPGADAIFVGHGPLEREWRELAGSLGLGDRTEFVPSQPQTALAAWYRAADVFVLPSVTRSESFGLVQLEAHAAGTPAVCTNLTTGVPYANLDGVTGLTVPVGSVPDLAAAIRKLLDDDDLRARLGRQARTRATTQFTVDRMVEGYRAVYRDVLARR